MSSSTTRTLCRGAPTWSANLDRLLRPWRHFREELDERLPGHRLGEESGKVPAMLGSRFVEGCDRDHGDLPGLRVILELLKEGPAVGPGERDVEEHRTRQLAAHRLRRLVDVAHRGDPVAGIEQ